MENINIDYEVPRYILEEIEEYIEETEKGRCRVMKWENIRGLMRLAIVNDRLTEEQAQILQSKYYKEN